MYPQCYNAAGSPERCVQIAQAGALSPLVRLLCDGSQEGMAYAAEALRILAGGWQKGV